MFTCVTAHALATIAAVGFLGFGGGRPQPDEPAVFIAETPRGTAVRSFEDASITVNTELGTLRFRLSDVTSLTGTADALSVETVARDVHHGILVTSPLRYRDQDGLQRYEPDRREAVSLQARHSPWTAAHTPPHIEIHLAGNRVIKVQRDGLRIPIRIQEHPIALPAAAVRALRLIADSRDRPATVIVSFLSGRVERGELEDPSASLHAVDLFGNRLQIPFHAIRSILGERSVLAALPVNGTRRHDGRIVVHHQDGRTVSGHLDPVLFGIDSNLGTVHIASELLLHMVPAGNDRLHVYSVAGERVTGRVSPRAITLRTAEGDVPIHMTEVSHVLFPGPAIPPPDGWMVAAFASGDKLLVRFPTRHPPYQPDNDAPVGSLQRITPTGRRTVLLDTAEGAIEARTESSRLELAALSLADHIRTRWSSIEHMTVSHNDLPVEPGSLKDPQPAHTPALAAVPTPETASSALSIWPRSSGTAPADSEAAPSPATVTIPTRFGSLELMPDRLAALHATTKVGTRFLETTQGDVVALTRLRGRQHAPLAAAFGVDAVPDHGVIRLREQGPSAESLPAWRLRDGSILHAKLDTPTLRFSDQDRRADAVDIDSDSIDALVQVGPDRFRLDTRHGPLEGRILTSQVDLIPAVTGEPVTVETAFIESMARAGQGRLPPALDEIPGLPARVGNQIRIEGGSFMQGNPAVDALPEETPPYPAVVSTFWMDRTPVTVAQFARFVEATGHTTTAEQQRRPTTWREPGFEQTPLDPVTGVSWLDAAAFCNWRSRQAGLTPVYTLERLPEVDFDPWADGFRLPTEAEWEFAARERGRELRYPWGNAPPVGNTAPANYRQEQGEPQDPWLHTSPVMAFPPNALGLYDLGGNVWEWCQDWYHENAYQMLRQRRPVDPLMAHPATGSPRRSIRGGAYNTGLDFMRGTSRGHGHPIASSSHVGFRCVRSAQREVDGEAAGSP